MPDRLAYPETLDWERVIEIGLDNRMSTLLEGVLARTGLMERLPETAALALEKGVARYEHLADVMSDALRQYLQHASERDQDVVVLKGLWLSEKIYGQASLRPGADIDLLLREGDIPQSIAILEEDMGYGTWWRPLLDDRYYQRHHLHQQRCNTDRSIWIEPHWLLDHPYTLLTVDYEALLDRTRPDELWGISVRELSPPDLLLALSIHLVKHAVYLPSVLERQDLQRLILADGMLIYFVDVAEAVGHYSDEMRWEQVIDLSRDCGTVDIMGSVLRICRDHLGTPVPEWVLEALAVTGPGAFSRMIMNRMVGYELSIYLGHRPSKIWGFLLGYKASIVFRPIRLLDLVHYAFPDGDYLRRQYGRASIANRVYHLLRTFRQYALVGWDTLYFTRQRRREVRELDRQGYVWPELPKFE